MVDFSFVYSITQLSQLLATFEIDFLYLYVGGAAMYKSFCQVCHNNYYDKIVTIIVEYDI